jgi:hypothetical protein
MMEKDEPRRWADHDISDRGREGGEACSPRRGLARR